MRSSFLPIFGLLALCAANLGATDYLVGPNQSRTSLHEVPWRRLVPGDRVLIHWRAEPYREKLMLSESGSADQPIHILGVRGGPDNALPILDGDNADSGNEIYPHAVWESRGLIVVGKPADYRWGYKPRHIVIENLDLRHAYQIYSFTNTQGGQENYRSSAASISIQLGENITIRGCDLTGSANGLFVASGGSEEELTRNITVEHCRLFANGTNIGSTNDRFRQHNAYTEAAGMIYQYNYFGPLRDGALGNALKDRSAGTVVRYNWIEGSAAFLLDLVEPEESARLMVNEPDFRTTYVYGNVLISRTQDNRLVHYGWDNVPDFSRGGTLFFYHNTVIQQSDRNLLYNRYMFRVSSLAETADIRNNIFYLTGDSFFYLAISGNDSGNYRLADNWLTEGDEALRIARDPFNGTVSGFDQFQRGTDPGFIDFDGGRLGLSEQAAVRAAAGPLPENLPAQHQPTRQYSPHQGWRTRQRVGIGADLGAFEFADTAPGWFSYLSAWTQPNPPNGPTDVNANGRLDVLDFCAVQNARRSRE